MKKDSVYVFLYVYFNFKHLFTLEIFLTRISSVLQGSPHRPVGLLGVYRLPFPCSDSRSAGCVSPRACCVPTLP